MVNLVTVDIAVGNANVVAAGGDVGLVVMHNEMDLLASS